MARLPSIKAMSAVFADAKQARKILEMTRAELENLPASVARIKACYNPPSTEDLRLHCLDALESGLYGVEAIESSDGAYADYLNAGDVYAPTLIYWNGSYRVQSLADFVESMERRGVRFD